VYRLYDTGNCFGIGFADFPDRFLQVFQERLLFFKESLDVYRFFIHFSITFARSGLKCGER